MQQELNRCCIIAVTSAAGTEQVLHNSGDQCCMDRSLPPTEELKSSSLEANNNNIQIFTSDSRTNLNEHLSVIISICIIEHTSSLIATPVSQLTWFSGRNDTLVTADSRV